MVNLLSLELGIVLVLIELYQWLEVAVIFVLVRVDDVLHSCLVINYHGGLVLHLRVHELGAETVVGLSKVLCRHR